MLSTQDPHSESRLSKAPQMEKVFSNEGFEREDGFLIGGTNPRRVNTERALVWLSLVVSIALIFLIKSTLLK